MILGESPVGSPMSNENMNGIIEENSTSSRYVVVGHRGYPKCYPENTELGLVAAVKAGVDAVEFDVQCTQDGELILLHDEDFERVAGVALHAHSVSFIDACEISVGEPKRFGLEFSHVKTSTLQQVSRALAKGPSYVFVEIKSEAVGYLGFDGALQKLIGATVDIADQRIFISYHFEFLQYLKEQTGEKIGWVMTHFDDASLKLAERLMPEYLICNKRKLPKKGALPNHGWKWFVYDVLDTQEATSLRERGVEFVESNDPVGLLPAVPA